MMKILRKIVTLTVIIAITFLLIFTLSYFILDNAIESTIKGVSIDANEITSQRGPNKYYLEGIDLYLVYGRYLKINRTKNYIALLGKDSQIWTINFDSNVKFMYQYPYVDETKEQSIYSFIYNTKEMFTRDVFIGKMIMIECENKYCDKAKTISIYDYNGKYESYIQ